MGSKFDLNKLSSAVSQSKHSPTKFQEETQRMYDALGSDGYSDVNYLSLGASGTEDLIKSLQPVSLANDELTALESFFYSRVPKGRGRRKADEEEEEEEGPDLQFKPVKRSRAFLMTLLDQVNDVTNSFNVFMMFMRSMLLQGRRVFAVEGDKKELETLVHLLFNQAMDFHDTLKSGTSYTESMNALVLSMMNGDKHSIRPSEFYSGGVDVILARSAQDSALMGSELQFGGHIESSVDSYGYIDNRNAAYLTETSLKVKEAAKEILEYLFGAGSELAAYQPQMRNLPLTTDFTEIQRIFERKVGVRLPRELFSNVTFGSEPNSYADRFVRICMVLHPEQAAGHAFTKAYKKLAEDADSNKTPNKEDAMNSLLNSETIVKHKVSQDVAPEAALFNRMVGSTITFTFDKATAKYISQSESEDINYNRFDNWFAIWSSQFLRKPRARVKNTLGQGRLKLANIPRYTLPISKLTDITKARTRMGMSVEETRANEDGLYVTPSGTLAYLPTQTDREQINTATEFEQLSEELSRIAAKYSMSVHSLSESYVECAKFGMPYEEYKEVEKKLARLISFEGSVLSYDWDYGLRIYATSRPGIVKCDVQIGAVKPDTLTVADYLGYNMAKEGDKPIEKTFADSVLLMTVDDPVGSDKNPEELYGSPSNAAAWVGSDLFTQVIQTYFFHSYKGELPGLQELCHRAMQELQITKLDAEAPRTQGSKIYKGQIEEDGTIKRAGIKASMDIELFQEILSETCLACSGASGSWVALDVVESLGGRPDFATVREQTKEHEDYFVPSVSPAHHIARLYNFIGGNMFKQMLEGINSLSVQQLTTTERYFEAEFNANYRLKDMPVRATKYTVERPRGSDVLNKVKPLAIMFGKYAPNFEDFKVEAEEAVRSIGRDESIDVDDIHFAGSNKDFSVFPHQLDTHRYLRKPKPPKFAVLDISPGGGKTSIGLGDMACIVKDMQGIGKKVRPLVLCPDGLVRNWCDDMKSFADDNWNMIPIDNAVFKRWGPQRLQALIESAPPNTIVVAGLNFLRNNKMTIVIGNAVINVGTNLEFIKAFKFNYIIIDESHKLKNPVAAKSKIARQLTTASFVDYLRIATGTLIADRVKDIEGQVALYSPHIFRSGELAQRKKKKGEDDDDLELGDEKIQLWRVDTPQRARQRLAMYAAVITKKKKEWAFMLPNPIEAFHRVDFVPRDGTEDEIHLGELHRELYDLVVQESMEALDVLLSKAKKLQGANEEEDDDDDDDEEDPEEGTGLREADLELGADDELGLLNESDVTPFLQRIERMIITPEHDPLFEQVFGAYGQKKYVSQKAKVIVGIVDEHFNPPKWDRGADYHEFDLVEDNGELYLARKTDLSTPRREYLPKEARNTSPAKNPKFWKKEPEGKIIIFCRYTNSVEAVYKALPAKYKSMAVRFTGEEVDKWSNLDAFKSDPKVKILIANEMGLSEGHNLQMASRMIRVESPWGPGELDQSASRIFRPDPKGAAAGEIYREAVYLDWVIADHTMEVAKQARLIAKVFNKARFDEAENPKYNDVLKDFDLPEISMSIEGTLQQRPSFSDYAEYVNGYATLNGLMRQEFHDMRVSQPSTMLPVPQSPKVDGATKILTPFVSSQDIPDPNGWKPKSLKQYLRSDLGTTFREDPQSLIGRPVITDLGNGMILSVKNRYVGPARGGVLDPARPISSFTVKLKDGTIASFRDLGLAYLPTQITPKAVKDNFAVDLTTRKADLRKQEQLQKDQDKLDAIRAAKEARRAEKEGGEAAVRRKSREAGTKRERNIKEGKPINQGVKFEPDMKVPTSVKRDADPARPPVSLAPAYYHGYLTLESEDIEYTKELKKLKFKEIGEYAFIVLNRRNQANAIMDYIEAKFHLSDQTAERLGAVFSAFEKGKRGIYNLELASPAELPHFFATRKQLVKDRLEARIFPFFMHDKLMLAVDVATSPIIKKHIGKAIPDAGTTWQLSQGALMYFATNKADLNAKIKEVKASGIEIADPDVLKKEVAEIAFRAPRKK